MLSTFLRSAAQATDSTLTGRPPQQKKQQHGISRVQQKICVVMASGVEVKELAVQGMRQPSQRMPVSIAKSGKRPIHSVPGKAALNPGIFQDIRRVIKGDELVMDDGIVKSEGGRHQYETIDDDAHFAGRGHVGSRRRFRWPIVQQKVRPEVRSSSTISRPSLPKMILTEHRRAM
jgi:hypothetical protein